MAINLGADFDCGDVPDALGDSTMKPSDIQIYPREDVWTKLGLTPACYPVPDVEIIHGRDFVHVLLWKNGLFCGPSSMFSSRDDIGARLVPEYEAPTKAIRITSVPSAPRIALGDHNDWETREACAVAHFIRGACRITWEELPELVGSNIVRWSRHALTM